MQTRCRVCALSVPHRHIGKWGWLGLTALVVLWDCVAPETLSAVFLRRRTNPVTILAWSVLTAHLFGLVPPRYDPILRTFRLVSGRF
jgi:hypothetical protein